MLKYTMHIDDLTTLALRFRKKKPDINDAVLWYKHIMEPLPVEDHPFYWPHLKEELPDIMVGGLYFPYSDAQMTDFLSYCKDHHLFYENIQKFQQQGAAVQWNRSIALKLLGLQQYQDFEDYYQNTSIWDHLEKGLDIRDAFDVALQTMDKPFFLWGLFPMLSGYDTHVECPKISATDMAYYFDLIEEQYPHLTEHSAWIDVRSFHQYHDAFEEKAQRMECSMERLRFELIAHFMAHKETYLLPYVPPVTETTSAPTIVYDDLYF